MVRPGHSLDEAVVAPSSFAIDSDRVFVIGEHHGEGWPVKCEP
jgi:hypothetical protein